MDAINDTPAWTTAMLNPFAPTLSDVYIQSYRMLTIFPLKVAANMLRFGSGRLKDQAEYLEKLQKCETPDQVVELQSSFLTNSFKDYEQEAESLAQTVGTATGVPMTAV